MKRNVILAMVLTIVSVCACSQNKKEQPVAPAAKTEVAESVAAAKPVEMTTAMFIEKIMDYKNSKEWKYKGNKPAVIDFYATWCGPCKQLSPIMDELAAEYGGNVDFYKVDVDREQELSGVFGIQSIPLVLLIPVDGQPMAIQGLHPKAHFQEAIASLLKKK